MAVCPKCKAAIAVNADRCSGCGATLQPVSDPTGAKLEALKDDIERFVQETAPEDAAEAERQVGNWRPTAVPAEVVKTMDEARPVPIFEAPDEMSARLVASLLESEGIDSLLDRHTMPMLDTARQMEEGIWGQVLVHTMDVDRAREILDAYRSADDATGTDAGFPPSIT